ncbi:DUF4167 domain-containing protein [Methyloceanibacter stevinii]|uniref:DUF4167 domain-containing protein n=1 Tax=Methyloceanibacter stevinii TaxID=1774970 RepID=UPI0009F22474
MRQGQQNRRGRGRSRKPQNPLARNYESNGPDVKIRGTASHVAEKYMSLARDALASGDIITAESYLQHAEHYNRIIMAAHSQAASAAPQAGDQPQGQQSNGSGGRNRQDGDDGAESDAGEGADSDVKEAGGASAEGRGRARGRQRRNGSHAAAEAQPSTQAQPAAEASPAAEAIGATEANGSDQPVDVAVAEESEGASGAVN